VLLILSSTSFNVLIIIWTGVSNDAQTGWVFADLGPAVIQDSYHDRAPALESPFGVIGDIPGGYSLYSGNPLQSDGSYNLSDWIAGEALFPISDGAIQFDYLLIAALFAFVPLMVIIIAGRRSFGSAKTQ
ncbi:MAG: hypothetical protein ACW985_05935, partial [Candidatus Thorarchaeota archaeon]